MAELSDRLASLSPAKRRLLEQRLAAATQVGEPVAIVGMACRFAGARNLDEYWRIIIEGTDATGEIPPDRWDVDKLYDPDPDAPGKMCVRWGGFVDDVDKFDPLFFGISPREASRMDPQQRLLLEVSWHALEDAAIPPDTLAGKPVGVFVGIGGTDYSKIPTHFENHLEYIDAHVGTGNALSIAANRISYVLDLRGPSFIVDTACSSALVAIHLAVGSLRSRECNVALAGGVNLILSPEVMIAFSKARMLSTTGKCRPFDASADGYVRGEGCGMLVLKRLSDALRDGDRIWAVIRGSAINQDGRTSGITAPNSLSQHRVIQAALANAGVSADQISYIEAHGTGTPLGDPLEIQGLEKLFRRQSESDPPCYITSVKANIGHTETASGVAGIIKVALMMHHGVIPPQLHFEKLNPNIHLDHTRLIIPTEPTSWNPPNGRRFAGVSSFGFGGTNAHVVLEAPTSRDVKRPEQDRPLHIFTLSARTSNSLDRLVEEYSSFLKDGNDESLADICHTANAGRSHFQHRLAILARDKTELAEKLKQVKTGQQSTGVRRGQVSAAAKTKVAFLFTGQGSQYVNMGRQLFETCPPFRNTLLECEEILKEFLPQPLTAVLYCSDEQQSPLDETLYTQPVLFALEYALAQLWQSWGIKPYVVMGHSLGEYVAACVAGVFSLEEGLRFVAQRAQLMHSAPQQGAMAAVFAPAAEVEKFLEPFATDVSIAAYNGPQNTVVSGKADLVDAILRELDKAGISYRRLVVSHAFHSPLMEPILDKFEQIARSISAKQPTVPIVSNVTGKLLWEAPDASYWRQHLRKPVHFMQGIETLIAEDVSALLEIGPAPTLLGMARRCSPNWQVKALPSLRKGQEDWQVLLGSLSELYLQGATIDWKGFDAAWPRRRLRLPLYPFEHSRYWLEPKTAPRETTAGSGPVLHPLLGRTVRTALPGSLFEARISNSNPAYLRDHQVQGSVVLPATAYVELALAAADQVYGSGTHAVENLNISQAMFLPDATNRVVQVRVSPEVAGQCDVEVYSVSGEELQQKQKVQWTLHAVAKLHPHSEVSGADNQPKFDPEQFAERVVDTKTRDQFYQLMRERQLAYGPAFQGLQYLERSHYDALGRLELPKQVAQELSQYRLHPALLDAALHIIAGVVPLEKDGSYSPYTYMPVHIRSVRLLADPGKATYSYAVRRSQDDRPSPEIVEADVFILDEQYRPVVEILGVRVQRVGRPATEKEEKLPQLFYRVEWQEIGPIAESAKTEELRNTYWVILSDGNGLGVKLSQKLGQAEADHLLVLSPDGPKNKAEEKLSAELSTSASHETQPLPLETSSAEATNNNPSLTEHTKQITIDFSDPAQVAELVKQIAVQEKPVTILDAMPLGIRNESPDAPDIARNQGCLTVIRLVQQLVNSGRNNKLAIWLVTQGAISTTNGDVTNPLQAAVWGLGRVLQMEHPELDAKLLDLPDNLPEETLIETILANAVNANAENQLAVRDSRRLAPRLRPAPDLASADQQTTWSLTIPKSPFRLRLGKPGSFDSLYFEHFQLPELEPNQVEVEVHATGLNFSDVLKAMGLYPGITDDIVPLGIECAGVVTRVGSGVSRFKPGDRVMGVVPYSFATRAITAEYALVHTPENISDEEAATIPITFLTAYHALCKLARLQPGERVLIHAGAGGVGLAAIQIAQHIGAEIFATAGSDEKRNFLRKLGVKHVFNSRTLEFADQILEVTNREGVDVVLNSLPGEAIPKSLSILRAYGRFLEIGKTDIYQNRMIGLLPFQNNLSYFAIDLDRILRQRPDYVRELFGEVIEHVKQGHFRPLPLTRFALTEIRDAFRFMAQRKNIGKIVISVADRPKEQQPDEKQGTLCRKDATYLITGGLGALGLQLAEFLADQGAGSLVLVARRPPNESAQSVIERLQNRGIRVTTAQADVTDRASLESALRGLPVDLPPIRGIIHAAGALADGMIFEMTDEQFDRAAAPKILGVWNLHQLTKDWPLDFFVLFSSVAAVFGSPGQANYAAGNAVLDAFAAYRKKLGLPATSINWGPWAGGGMATSVARQLEARGMRLLEPRLGLEAFATVLRAGRNNAIVVDADWQQVGRSLGQRPSPILQELTSTESDRATQSVQVDHAFLKKLASADLSARRQMLREYFGAELARIMGIDPSEIDPAQPLSSLGLDSLMAMELKNNLETRLAFNLPMAKFMENPTLDSLAEAAAELVGPIEPDAQTQTGPSTKWTPVVKLKQTEGRPPLFCLHALGGDVRCYRDLARAMPDPWPVYGLAARGADGVLPPIESWEELIAEYKQAIQQMQPSGPLFLAGWSAGGIFAMELARSFLADGRTIGLLAFFDTPLPSVYDGVDLNDYPRFLADLAEFVNRFTGANMNIDYEQLSKLPTDQVFEVALQEAKAKGVVPAEASTEFIRRLCEVARTNVGLIMAYNLRPLPVEITMFLPKERGVLSELSGQKLESDLGWSTVEGQKFVIVESPGDHFTMMTGENATELARLLFARLEKAFRQWSGSEAHLD